MSGSVQGKLFSCTKFVMSVVNYLLFSDSADECLLEQNVVFQELKVFFCCDQYGPSL